MVGQLMRGLHVRRLPGELKMHLTDIKRIEVPLCTSQAINKRFTLFLGASASTEKLAAVAHDSFSITHIV